MKKAIALLLAAAGIFAVAGCTNKKPAENNGQAQPTLQADSQQSVAAEEGVTGLSETVRETVTERPTRRPTITTYATRATSPNHLTERPTTTQRTTITINAPTRKPTTRRETTLKTTALRTTAAELDVVTTEVTTKAVPEPVFNYGGTLSLTTGEGLTDSVRIVSHTCTPTDRGTFAIMLTVEIVAHESPLTSMRLYYNCYAADGTRINEKTLQTVVPLNAAGERVNTVATATLETAKVIFTAAEA